MSDYSNDIETYQIDDQYLIGEDLLVAPIIYGQTQRKVYVPQGCWVDYWTGEAKINHPNEFMQEFIADELLRKILF